MKKIFKYILASFALMSITSCVNDLEVTPIDPNITFESQVFESEEGYYQVLGKIYAGYHVAGQKGNDNESDVSTIPDGGQSSYLRNYWNLQTLPTGEALNAWNDNGLVPLQNGAWSADNQYVAGMFYRLYYMIALTNEFLRQSSDSKLDERGQGGLKETLKQARAEARLVRAITYYHGIDLYGQMSVITEGSADQYPTAIKGKELFTWIINELNEIESLLPEAGQAEYGRMDKGTLWMVKAKMFLNARPFTGEDNPYDGVTSMNEVITLTEQLIAAYPLDSNLLDVFSVGNETATGIIHKVPLDPVRTQGFSATQYVISAGTSSTYNDWVGVAQNAAWGGNHATRSIYDKFTGRPSGDKRGATQSLGDVGGNANNLDFSTLLVINAGLEVDDPLNYTQGLNVFKFKNRKSDGSFPDIAEKYFVDTDWPLFRIADAYLMYAEAKLRGASNGTDAQALTYVNAVIARAYGNTSANITSADLNLDFLLEERGREFYWEGYRRQDLNRFNNSFTSPTYLWPWKGGVQGGRGLDSYRVIYPIPTQELAANPNAKQNTGY
ncbi:RagB/SusD family nutrient uptake outer membrane protein [Flammeovirga sp. MY04]|uniref:RagB/SusD family nutrient uptake outer membrane protein n=1 Tax=Flammeovirga sp. MY04 TaxID=1191459 RepID=UPI000825C93F|nr:RagB/SusD family nutrient uptake outer membrane protein [Flammeovirga sp. MY04]ANQ47997.2 RagB/SusD family nutrient uptake outer membrane protein [Flammeovirga sp. MY04]